MPNRFALAFILITVVIVIDPMRIGLIMAVVQDLIRELRGAGPGEAALCGGMLATAFAVMQFLFGPFAGNLTDCYGRRPLPIRSLVVRRIRLPDHGGDGFDPEPAAWPVMGGVTAATHATALA